jgi:hypothetical protein
MVAVTVNPVKPDELVLSQVAALIRATAEQAVSGDDPTHRILYERHLYEALEAYCTRRIDELTMAALSKSESDAA